MMPVLEQAGVRLREFWNNIAPPGKIALIAVPCSLIAIFAAILFSGNESYVPICEGMDDRTVVFTFVDSLEQAEIPHKISDRGHSVSVPFKHLSEAARILASTVETGRKDGESTENNFFSNSIFNPSLNNRNSDLRIRERHMSRNIGCYKGVRNARVMITPPDSRLFAKKEHKEPCASVFLELSGSQPVSACRISGIKDLVAASYQGLSRDKISITDSLGTDYNLLVQKLGEKEDEALFVEQQRAETIMQQKVERHLSVMFGKKNISVAASIVLVRSKINRKSQVGSLCLSVLLNKGTKGLKKLTPELQSSIIDNISNLARVDSLRGDTVSIEIVPFKTEEKSKQTLCKVDSSLRKPFSDAVTLSTSSFFGSARRAPFNIPGWFVLTLLSIALCCVMIFIVRRGAAKGAFDDEFWHPGADFHFSDVEGTFCELSDFSPLDGCDDRLYREEVVSRTASEDPMAIASLIRRNEGMKNGEW